MTSKSKTGLPPGSLIYTGEAKDGAFHIRWLSFSAELVSVEETNNVSSLPKSNFQYPCNWFHVTGIGDIKSIEALGNHFGIHALWLEDILNTRQRPKLEFHENQLFLTLQSLSFDPQKLRVQQDQVSIILGSGFVLTFHDQPSAVFNPIEERITNAGGRVRRQENDYLFYALFDCVVDHFVATVERYGDSIHKLETDVIKNRTRTSEAALRQIMRYRAELLKLRRHIQPLREVFPKFEKAGDDLITSETKRYLNDVQDHVVQTIDIIEMHRESLNNLLEIHLSHSSNRLNQVMKVLTIISTIFIPLTFVAGIYGMNFRNMPELEHPLGYPAVLVFMTVCVVGMLLYFRKKEWL